MMLQLASLELGFVYVGLLRGTFFVDLTLRHAGLGCCVRGRSNSDPKIFASLG